MAGWSVPRAAAGAFLQPAGRGQVITTVRFESSDSYVNSAGKIQAVRDYRKFELQTYVEYGLNDWITLIVAPSASQMQTSVPANPVHRETDIRDTYARVEAGARFRLFRGKLGVVSFQVTAGAGGKIAGGQHFGVRQDRNELDVRLLYGRNFNHRWGQGFVDLQSGYRMRAGAADEWRTDLTLGLRIRQNWLLLLQNFNLVSLPRTGSQTRGFAGARPAERMKRSHKGQVSLVYRFNRNWSVQAGAFTTFAARNARRDNGFVAAIWRQF